MTTRIGFQGFAAGADVVLSSGDDVGTTGADGWPVQAQSGIQQSARIVLRRSQLQVAPEGINFEVIVDGFDTPGPVGGADVYDPRFHDLYYVWDFGDPGSVFTAPEHVPDVHKDANRAYGPIASHTYQRADSYVVRCLVIEPSSGKTALASTTVTIGDPEVLFAGERTIFVSTDSGFTRAPEGARTVDTPMAAYTLQSSLQSGNTARYYRIMFDRVVEHDWSHTNSIAPRDNFNNVYLCAAPGEGSPPVIRCSNPSSHTFFDDQTARNTPGKRTDIVFDGLSLDGYFDVTTETMGGPYAVNHAGGQAFYSTRSPGSCTYLLFNNVIATGFNTLVSKLVQHQDGPDAITTVFNNTQINSWSNFGIFEVEQGFTAGTGCRIRQDPLALSGGTKGGLGHNEHGPWRIQLAGKCVMHACDMFSRNGWFENTKGIHMPQPCVRWNQSGDPRGKLNMQGCTLEGPSRVFESGRDGVRTPGVTPNNILVDKTIMVAGVFALDVMVTQHPGMTVRNCLFAYGGDRTVHGAFPETDFIRLDARWDDAVYLNTPNNIYSNTFLNHMSDTQSQDGAAAVATLRLTNVVAADFTRVTVENNVLHQPNLTTPDVPFDPLGKTPLFLTRYDDYRSFSSLSEAATLAEDVPDGTALFVNYSLFRGGRTQADFVPAPGPKLAHQVIVDNQVPLANFVFDAAGVTVTNTSGSPWVRDAEVRLNLGVRAVDIRPEYATPDDVAWAAAPQVGSAAIGAALSGMSALDDFYGYARPSYPSVGAFEVTD